MITLLALAVVAGIVLALFALYRNYVERRRKAGELIQELVRPASVEWIIRGFGMVAVACLMILVGSPPLLWVPLWWVLLIAFGTASFLAACWVSGLYRYAFHEHGLCYGRKWYPYKDFESYQMDFDQVSVVTRRKRLAFRTQGDVSLDVRTRLAVVGWD